MLILCFSITCVSASENTNDTLQITSDLDQTSSFLSNEDSGQNDELLTAGEVYVNGSVDTSGSGSVDSPYKTINEAISSSNEGDVIYIASGTYSGEGNVALTIDKGLSLMSYGNEEVILDGEDNSWILYVTSSNVLINGITFKNANAQNGAAVYYESGSTNNIINNSKFINNYASSCAGAVFYRSGSNSQILNSVFENNSAWSGGAILYWFDSDNNTISNCNFSDNNAFNDNGGAIYFYYGSTNSVFNNNIFSNNVALYRGGAIYYYWTVDNISFINSTFKNNKANYGSALYAWYVNSLNLMDDTFIGNKAISNSLTTDIDKFERNISAVFSGGDNIMNAIYSASIENFNISNNIFLSQDGLVNSDDVELLCSDLEAGMNITCEIYDNVTNELLFNITQVTDINGSAVFDYSSISSDNYLRYAIYHIEDEYYTAIESTGEFNPNMGDFEILQYLVDNASENDIINLTRDYTYTICVDTITSGINVNKRNLTINGNGFTIDALCQSRIFNVLVDSFNLNNLTLKNAYYSSNGGAIYLTNAIINSNLINIDFINNTAQRGASIYANNAVDNVILDNLTFINNRATSEAAGIYLKATSNILINNTLFEDNLGKAIIISSKSTNNTFYNVSFINNIGGITISGESNSDSFVNLTFINNTVSKKGGAIYFKRIIGAYMASSTFINNTAGTYGGAIYIESDSKNNQFINLIFDSNIASSDDGGAISFEEDIVFSNSSFRNVSFINNTARYGGAIYYRDSEISDVSFIDSEFISNSAKNGGAIIYYGATIENVDYINVLFENNVQNSTSGSTTGGGAISYYASTTSTNERIINSSFINNSAYYAGGAIYYYSGPSDNYSIINTTFINNSAVFYAGAIYLGSMANGKLNNVTCINNTAGTGGAIYFIRDCSNNTISNSLFANNTRNAINYYGSAAKGDEIINSIFLVNDDNEIIYATAGSINANYNWFGNNATDYTVKPKVSSVVTLTNWLFLNATANETTVFTGDSNYAKFILEVYDSISGNISDNDYRDINPFTLSLTSVNEELTNNYSLIYDDVEFISVKEGNGSITAKFMDAEQTIQFSNVKSNSSVVVDDISVKYGTEINLVANTTKSIGITAKLYDVNGTDVSEDYLSVDGFNITVAKNLDSGDYTLNVTTLVDEESYYSSTNSSKISIRKANSTVHVDDLTTDYVNVINLTAICANATGIVVELYNGSVPVVSADIVVDGFNISISGLDVGSYVLNVTTVVDGNHFAVSNSSVIDVGKANSTVYVDDVAVIYGDVINLTAICANATGIVVELYNGSVPVVSADIVVDGFNISISGLDVGSYVLNVTTVVDGNHFAVSNSSVIDVGKANSTVYVDDLTSVYPDVINLTAVCTNAIGINATIHDIDGVDYSDNLAIDGFNLIISDLAVGHYVVNTTTIVDKNYNSVSNVSSIEIKAASSSVSVDNVTVTYGDDINLTATCINATGISASVYDIDGIEVDANLTIDGFNIIIDGLNAGNYTLLTKTIVSDYYTSESTVSSIVVNKANVIIILNSTGDINPSQEEQIVISLSEEIASNLTYYVNDEYGGIVEDNLIILDNLTEGNYTVIVEVNDSNYNYASNYTIFNVQKVNSNITLEVEDITVGEEELILVFLPGDATGNLTICINNVSEVININESTVHGLNGILVLYLVEDSLNAGYYSVNVTYNGNKKYNPSMDFANFTVYKKSDYNVTYECVGDVLTVNISENVTGNVTIQIGNNTYVAKINNATASFNLSDLDTGYYNIVILCSGDEIYANSSIEGNISISRPYSLIADDLIKYYGGSERFYMYLHDGNSRPVANAKLTLEINGVSYSRTTNENGSASIAINLNAGEYIVTVSYNGTDLITSNATIIVKSTVNGTDIVKIFKNDTQYYATFRDSAGNYLDDGSEVQFNIHGVFYNPHVNGGAGLAKLNINLDAGNYIITATNLVTGEMYSNNITVLPKIIENSDLVKYYRNDSQYVVRIVNDDGSYAGAGEVVTFNINGVFYNRTTNESGYAKLNINLEPGEYIITADCGGCKVSNNITVKPILSANDLTMSYGDGSTFDAALVDGQGNPLYDAKITFNINGVFYNRYTNSRGIASLNINLMPGQYIITSEYDGSKISNNILIT